MRRNLCVCGVSCLFLLAAGCTVKIPEDALRLSSESMQARQMETRRFDTTDENKLLGASAALLQDMGFGIEESNASLGVLVGSKERSAVDAAQVTLAIVAAIGGVQTPIDTTQKMRASLITRPLGNGKETLVRITFQRIVFNSHGQISAAESIIDQQIYQEFFSKLSKSVFLQANQI